MKKHFVLAGALLAVFLLSGCGNQAQESGEKTKPAGENPTDVQTEKKDDTGGLFSGSIKDLLAKGSNMQCAWSSTDESGKVSGTVYVSGDKFFQDFSTTQVELGEIKSYLLNDGEWIYQWNSMSKMGTKMKTSEVEKMAEDVQKNSPVDTNIKPNEEGRRNIDLNDKVDYNCQKWNVDASKFVLPADIQFNDFSQMLNNLPKAGSQKPTDVCQMCGSLPAEAKAACLANCNK
ncbi:MAG: hypothetical protein WC848_01365 [Parcubacteria group bacterium]|jgi:hypothetical protein